MFRRVASKLWHSPWTAGALGTLIYLLTMARSVSWWDCGEFLSTGWTLGVGHPPGAPVYQLLQHMLMLLSFGHTRWIPILGNAASALCAGATVGVLFATLRMLKAKPQGSWVGAMCYCLCHTAWFSAVESEVYAMAMLICALQLLLALRFRRGGDGRLLCLMALLAGLGVGVHLLTLLVLPACAVLMWRRALSEWRMLPLMTLFLVVGISPYVVVPLRAAANPEINEMGSDFGSYVRREQYEKAPLWPRQWRERDADNHAQWNLGLHGAVAEVVYAVRYQLGYMYGRYLIDNFFARRNLQWRCTVLFVLPLLLGLVGILTCRKRSRAVRIALWAAFLLGGVLLNIYLNHPCYEPRERDYAYVLSFYAFAIWIGIGTDAFATRVSPRFAWLPLLAPVLMAVGNWSDHDRSRCHSVRDIAAAHLESCDPDAILITLGDNDTFPLWYMQQVEGVRRDVQVLNVGLAGWSQVLTTVRDNMGVRPVYVSHYFRTRYGYVLGEHLRCEGFCHRLLDSADAVDDETPLRRHRDNIQWHITQGEYLDEVSRAFLRVWQENTGQHIPPLQ